VKQSACVRAEGQAPSSDPPDELGGSALRLLHQLASATSAAEALARTSPPAAPTLMAAMGWGMAGSALALETLQRALTLANRARDSLVGSALGAGLVQVLLQRLDWRSGSGADADNQVPLHVFVVNPSLRVGIHALDYITAAVLHSLLRFRLFCCKHVQASLV